ncbi:MAG: hypothetical protein JWO06_2644, partial [Bacteroidota bacterium]|nr:hypothetical protein [Bacteroidota bacterium]
MNLLMIEKTFMLIENLMQRPNMVVGPDTGFKSIRAFLVGYLQGLGQALNIDIHKKISTWFQKKVNQDSSLFWSEHITRHCENLPENERTIFFLQTVENFFVDNSDLL